MRRASRVHFLLLVVPALLSCRTIDGTYGVPPFYEEYPSPSTVIKDASGVEEEGVEVWVRPLYGHEKREDAAERFRSFPPFVDFEWTKEGSRYWVLPLWSFRRSIRAEGDDVDWFLLPFFFGGRDPHEGSYFAVFPFYGKLKGLLGKDEIDFALFPLYWHARDGERQSLHVLWPFFNFAYGGDWKGWRFWPFYARYRQQTREGKPRWDRGFVLWPFYIRQQDRLHEEHPTDLLFTFPFYGYKETALTSSRTFLWPLYQYHRNKKTGQRLHMGYLFPFRFTDGQKDFWPLFGTKRTVRPVAAGTQPREHYRHFALWPIERYEWASDGRTETTRFWLLPLLWHFHYIDRATATTRTKWKVWPFLFFRREAERVDLDILSPLWFHRRDFDRFYARWFSIFRYRWKPHVSGWEILYGTVMYRKQSGTAAPVRGRGDFAVDETVFSLLGGLFAAGHRDGKLVLRLLWIPWW